MNHQNETSTSKKITYRKRKKTLKKKAEELSILCGVPVGLVCIESDGKVETWPQEKDKIHQILQDYIIKENINSASVFKDKNFDKKKREVSYETWDSRLDYLPEESLIEFLKFLESKEKILEERLRVGDVKKKSKLGGVQIHDCNGDGLSTLRLGYREILQIATDNDNSVGKHTIDSHSDENAKALPSFSDNEILENNCDLELKLFRNGQEELINQAKHSTHQQL